MQVLNAPTRKEIDEAHFRCSWFGIGVPSVRNAFRVSRFKTWAWMLLMLTSVPIHLLFNSTIFEVDTRESDFHVTVATEEFLHGGAFYPPGASLLPTSGPSYDGYGYLTFPIDMSDYSNLSSLALANISTVLAHGVAWERLNVNDVSSIHFTYHNNP
jgi:hypothetical protein